MGIPLPNVEGGAEFKSVCPDYDGNKGTSGLCNGWITATQKCTRRTDELAQSCDGMGKFPAEIEAKHK